MFNIIEIKKLRIKMRCHFKIIGGNYSQKGTKQICNEVAK